MSAQSIINYLQITPDGDHLNFWDAPFKDMHLYVPESTRIVIDAASAANLPGLADKYLGSPYYWWVLLMYNGLSDAVNEVVPGKILSIPDLQRLGVFLQNRVSSQNAGNYLPTVNVTTL